MPLTEDIVKKIIEEKITQRFQSIGIWDQTKEQLEDTRANNKLINELRLARDERQGLLKRSFLEIFSTIGGNLIWVILTAGVVWALQFLPGNHKGQ